MIEKTAKYKHTIFAFTAMIQGSNADIATNSILDYNYIHLYSQKMAARIR